MTKVFLLLLSKNYVNQNAAKEFKLNKDLGIEFLLTFTYMNHSLFKKVAIVKEYISCIIDYIDVNQSTNNWRVLETLGKYLDLNNKMLIQGIPKLKKMKEVIDKKVAVLKKEEQEYTQLIDNHNIEEDRETQ